MKVRTLSIRGLRASWIIDFPDIEGRPALPLREDRLSYSCGWDIYLFKVQKQNTQVGCHTLYVHRVLHPAMMFNSPTHTHTQGTDIKLSDHFQKRVLPSFFFHLVAIFTAQFCLKLPWYRFSMFAELSGSVLVFMNRFLFSLLLPLIRPTPGLMGGWLGSGETNMVSWDLR